MECRICGSDLAPKEAVSCARCNAAFHRDCWLFNGKCGIYGCGGRTYVGFRLQASNMPVEITEKTKAPVVQQRLMQAMVRRLPEWGRLIIPSLMTGVAATAVVILAYPLFTAISPGLWLIGHLALCGLLPGIIGPFLGGAMRRHPVRVFLGSLLLSIGLYAAGRPLIDLIPALEAFRTTLLALCVVVASIGSNSIVEYFTAPYRFSRPPVPLLMMFVRPVLTGLALAATLIGLTAAIGAGVDMGWVEHVPELLCIGFGFGLFVAAPPLELSKSAYYRKLIADSIRRPQLPRE